MSALVSVNGFLALGLVGGFAGFVRAVVTAVRGERPPRSRPLADDRDLAESA